MSGLFRRDDVTLRYTLFPREIFRRDEEDRRRRPSPGVRGTERSPASFSHRRGGLTKSPAEKIRGTAGVVRELCGLWRTGVLAILVAAALQGIFGCRTINQTLQKRNIPCGVYRWRVKTLTDPEAEAIRFEPIDTTIHDLARLLRPGPDHRRRTAEEFSVSRVKAVVAAIHT